MTQIFICGLSTSQTELNDQDLEFYRDTKNKEISEVRQCLDFLSAFSACSKKEKMQADLQTVWKSMTVLSRILGYEADFSKINKLSLPEGLLIQDLLFSHNLFIKRSLRPRQLITHWENEVEQYVILLSGVVEKQTTRTSILQSQHQNLTKTDYGRSKRNLRKRFTRIEGQIPVCLNSKRSEVRYGEICSGNFRSVTSAQVFQVQLSFWKKYVEKFKQIQEDYILNFIRKKLGMNLNFQIKRKTHISANLTPNESKQKTKQKDELKPSNFYSIEAFDRKATVDLTNQGIYILYQGQMLVASSCYKLQMSKGCVLNSAIHEYLGVITDQKVVLANATAKTECIVIKLRFDMLSLYLLNQEDDFRSLLKFLTALENHRKNNREEELGLKKSSLSCNLNLLAKNTSSGENTMKKLVPPPQNQSTSLLKQNIKNLLLNTKNTKFIPNCKHQAALMRKTESQAKLRAATRKHIFEWKEIQERINKQERVVELKDVEYHKKKVKTESMQTNENYQVGEQFADDYTKSIYNSSIFRNCMSRIQNHSAVLAKAVQQCRKKKIEDKAIHQSNITVAKPKQRGNRDVSIKLIKQKVREIYMKTTQNEELLPHINERSQEDRGQCVQPLTFAFKNLEQESSMAVRGFDLASRRGVMKKVKRGQIRRIKLK